VRTRIADQSQTLREFFKFVFYPIDDLIRGLAANVGHRPGLRMWPLGYLERGGDEKAEGMAIEAYLGDSL
jgi:hypothetical protein